MHEQGNLELILIFLLAAVVAVPLFPPPGLGAVTRRVLAASQHVIVPLQCEPLALQTTPQILRSIQRRPARTSYMVATIFAVVWVLAGIVLGWMYLPELKASLGPSGLSAPSLGVLAIILFSPIILFFVLAHDLLAHVLDRHQSFGAAIFVDDDGQMDSLAAHPGQQVEDAHALGHEQGMPKKRRHRPVAGRVVDRLVDVLDVDHALDMVELGAIDGQAAMLRLGEGRDQVVEADVARDRDDLAAIDRYLARRSIAEMQQVAQPLALERGEVAALLAAFLGLVERFPDLVAHRAVMLVAEDQGADPAPQPAAFSRVARHQAAPS